MIRIGPRLCVIACASLVADAVLTVVDGVATLGTHSVFDMDLRVDGARFHATLRALDGESRGASARLDDDPDSEIRRARLGPVTPGRYELTLQSLTDKWTGRTAVDLSDAVESSVVSPWRPPRLLPSVVLDGAGEPVADIPVRVRTLSGGIASRPGSTRCARPDEAPDLFSATDGYASLEIDPPLPESVDLRLRNGTGVGSTP